MNEEQLNIDNMIESVAPREGTKIIDKDEAISDPQKRASDPEIVGSKDVRKEGVKIVTARGTRKS